MKWLKKSYIVGVSLISALALGTMFLAACTSSGSSASSSTGPCDNSSTNITSQQKYLQCITGQLLKQLTTAEPYPLASMKDSAELANLKARLIRLNDPNKIGYLYGLSSTGQVMAFWTIRGKVSSMGSQMTNTQNAAGRADNGGIGGTVVDSVGDDGSFGPEECAGQGVFAFTSDTDALIEWCGPWFYSDAPLKLSTAPIIAVTAQPPTTPVPVGGSTKNK